MIITSVLQFLVSTAAAQDVRIMNASHWVFVASQTGHPAAFEQGSCADEPMVVPDPYCTTPAEFASHLPNVVTRQVALGKGVVADLLTCNDRTLLLDALVEIPEGRGNTTEHLERLTETLARASGVSVQLPDRRSTQKSFRIPAFHGTAREFLVQAINPPSSEWLNTYAVREDGLGGWRIAYSEVTFLVLPEDIGTMRGEPSTDDPNALDVEWTEATPEERTAMQNVERSRYNVPTQTLLFGTFAEDERTKRRCGKPSGE